MFAVLVAASLVVAPQGKDKEKELPEAAKKELKALEGKWKIVKTVDSAKESEPDPKQPDVHLVFKGNEMTMEFGDKKETSRITDLDPSTDPKCLDLTEKRPGRPDRILECVYKIEKDTLRFAVHIPLDAKQRPTGFDKPTDPRTMVWTLKRVKD